MERLRSVLDSPHAARYLYPAIAGHAGDPKAPEGVEMMVRLAIADYAASYPDAVTAILGIALPRFVRALTEASTPAGDDPEPSFPVPSRAAGGLPQGAPGGGTGPRGAAMNNGASFSNGPETPRLIRRSLPPGPQPVTRFSLGEGDPVE